MVEVKNGSIVTNEEILSSYKQYAETKEVFVYLPNATLQGIIDKISPDFMIISKTIDGKVIKTPDGETVKTFISNSHLVDISPVIKNDRRY